MLSIIPSIARTKMSQYFPKPYEPYATKTDIKNISHVDVSSFALKSNLTSLKTEVDKLNVDKLKGLPNNLSLLKSNVGKLDLDKLLPVPVDLSKLSNVVKNEVLKKNEC